jgi:hypothetical protein
MNGGGREKFIDNQDASGKNSRFFHTHFGTKNTPEVFSVRKIPLKQYTLGVYCFGLIFVSARTNMSRGLGWRIHESVEDTKLSTNKQHTLSKTSSSSVGPLQVIQAHLNPKP